MCTGRSSYGPVIKGRVLRTVCRVVSLRHVERPCDCRCGDYMYAFGVAVVGASESTTSSQRVGSPCRS